MIEFHHLNMRLPHDAAKALATKRAGGTIRRRIRVTAHVTQQLLLLGAMVIWPFLYRPSWRWDLVASVLYLAGSVVLLRAFFSGVHTDEALDS